MCKLTRNVATFLVASIDAVSISITAPAQRDAVTVLTLELILITLQITAMLKHKHSLSYSSVHESLLPYNKCKPRSKMKCQDQLLYLIRSIRTVVISITLPPSSNTTSISAGELTFWTLTGHWERQKNHHLIEKNAYRTLNTTTMTQGNITGGNGLEKG